jgi:hypothetical protein
VSLGGRRMSRPGLWFEGVVWCGGGFCGCRGLNCQGNIEAETVVQQSSHDVTISCCPEIDLTMAFMCYLTARSHMDDL